MKFCFVIFDFEQGGINSSLVNLTNKLLNEGHKVGFLNLSDKPIIPREFDNRIQNIKPNNIKGKINITREDFTNANLLGKFYFALVGIAKKILGLKWYKFRLRKLKNQTFDVSIAYRPTPVTMYVCSKVIKSKQSVVFFHVEPLFYKKQRWHRYFNCVDKIAAVSNSVKTGLVEWYPSIKNKVYVVYNIFDRNLIHLMAEKAIKRNDLNRFEIVTVSRIELDGEKQTRRIPLIAAKIIEKGFSIHWTIVGNGKDFDELQKSLHEKQLDNIITLVGSQNNPFTFVRNSDLYVSVSLCESYGMAIAESIILNVPVLVARYPAAIEVVDEKYGVIVDNDVSSITDGIIKMISDKNFYSQKKENCKNENFPAEIGYTQFFEMIYD